MREAEPPSKTTKSSELPKTDTALKADEALSGTMEDRIHVIFTRVYYEDTDALGLVYYANYLKFMERGRTDMLRLMGIGRHDPEASEGEGLFVVRRCIIDYLAPAKLDDVLEIRTCIAGIGGASLDLAQAVCRDGKTLVMGQIKIACIGENGRPRKISPKIRQKLQHLLVQIQPKADVNA